MFNTWVSLSLLQTDYKDRYCRQSLILLKPTSNVYTLQLFISFWNALCWQGLHLYSLYSSHSSMVLARDTSTRLLDGLFTLFFLVSITQIGVTPPTCYSLYSHTMLVTKIWWKKPHFPPDMTLRHIANHIISMWDAYIWWSTWHSLSLNHLYTSGLLQTMCYGTVHLKHLITLSCQTWWCQADLNGQFNNMLFS